MLILVVLSCFLLSAAQGSRLSFKWDNGLYSDHELVDTWSYFINFNPTTFNGMHFTKKVMTPTRSGALSIRSRNPIGNPGQFVCIINIVTRVTVSCTGAQGRYNVILNGLNTSPSDKFIMTISNKQSMVYTFPTRSSTSGDSQLFFDGNISPTKSVWIRCQGYPCQYIPASSNGDMSLSRYVARPTNDAQLKMWIVHPKRSLDLLVCVTSTAKETFHYLDPCFVGKSNSYNQAQIADGTASSSNLYTTGAFRPYQPPSTPPALMTVPAGTIVSKDRRLEVTVHLYVDATRENRTMRMNCSSTNGWCRTIPEPVLVDFSFLHYDFRTPEVITNVEMLADVESEFYVEARMLNVGEENYEICVRDDHTTDIKCVSLPSSGATTRMDIKTGLTGSLFSKAHYGSRNQSILIKYEPNWNVRAEWGDDGNLVGTNSLNWDYHVSFQPANFTSVSFGDKTIIPLRAGPLRIYGMAPAAGISNQYVCAQNRATKKTNNCTLLSVGSTTPFLIFDGLVSTTDVFTIVNTTRQSMIYAGPTVEPAKNFYLFFTSRLEGLPYAMWMNDKGYPHSYTQLVSTVHLNTTKYIASPPVDNNHLTMTVRFPKRSPKTLVCYTTTSTETFHYLDVCHRGQMVSSHTLNYIIVNGSSTTDTKYTGGSFRAYEPPTIAPALLTIPTGLVALKTPPRVEVMVRMLCDATRENRTMRLDCPFTDRWCRVINESIPVDFSFLHYDFRTPEVITNVKMAIDIGSTFYVQARTLGPTTNYYKICRKGGHGCYPLPKTGEWIHMDAKTGRLVGPGGSFSTQNYAAQKNSFYIEYNPQWTVLVEWEGDNNKVGGWWSNWNYHVSFQPDEYAGNVKFGSREIFPLKSGSVRIHGIAPPAGTSSQYACSQNRATGKTIKCTPLNVGSTTPFVIFEGVASTTDIFTVVKTTKQSMVYSFPIESAYTNTKLFFKGELVPAGKTKSLWCKNFPCNYVYWQDSNADLALTRYVARPTKDGGHMLMCLNSPKRSSDTLTCSTSTPNETFHYLDPCTWGESATLNQFCIVNGTTSSDNLYTVGTFRAYEPPTTAPSVLTPLPSGEMAPVGFDSSTLSVRFRLISPSTREDRTIKMNCSIDGVWCRAIPESIPVDFSFLHYDFRTPELITNVYLLGDTNTAFYVEVEPNSSNLPPGRLRVCLRDDSGKLTCQHVSVNGTTTRIDIKPPNYNYVARGHSISISARKSWIEEVVGGLTIQHKWAGATSLTTSTLMTRFVHYVNFQPIEANGMTYHRYGLSPTRSGTVYVWAHVPKGSSDNLMCAFNRNTDRALSPCTRLDPTRRGILYVVGSDSAGGSVSETDLFTISISPGGRVPIYTKSSSPSDTGLSFKRGTGGWTTEAKMNCALPTHPCSFRATGSIQGMIYEHRSVSSQSDGPLRWRISASAESPKMLTCISGLDDGLEHYKSFCVRNDYLRATTEDSVSINASAGSSFTVGLFTDDYETPTDEKVIDVVVLPEDRFFYVDGGVHLRFHLESKLTKENRTVVLNCSRETWCYVPDVRPEREPSYLSVLGGIVTNLDLDGDTGSVVYLEGWLIPEEFTEIDIIMCITDSVTKLPTCATLSPTGEHSYINLRTRNTVDDPSTITTSTPYSARNHSIALTHGPAITTTEEATTTTEEETTTEEPTTVEPTTTTTVEPTTTTIEPTTTTTVEPTTTSTVEPTTIIDTTTTEETTTTVEITTASSTTSNEPTTTSTIESGSFTNHLGSTPREENVTTEEYNVTGTEKTDNPGETTTGGFMETTTTTTTTTDIGGGEGSVENNVLGGRIIWILKNSYNVSMGPYVTSCKTMECKFKKQANSEFYSNGTTTLFTHDMDVDMVGTMMKMKPNDDGTFDDNNGLIRNKRSINTNAYEINGCTAIIRGGVVYAENCKRVVTVFTPMLTDFQILRDDIMTFYFSYRRKLLRGLGRVYHPPPQPAFLNQFFLGGALSLGINETHSIAQCSPGCVSNSNGTYIDASMKGTYIFKSEPPAEFQNISINLDFGPAVTLLSAQLSACMLWNNGHTICESFLPNGKVELKRSDNRFVKGEYFYVRIFNNTKTVDWIYRGMGGKLTPLTAGSARMTMSFILTMMMMMLVVTL